MTNLVSIQFSVHIYVVHSLQHSGYLAITTQKDEFEDIKGVICKSKDRQHAGQKKKDKQRSAKRYSEIYISITTNPPPPPTTVWINFFI